jgi:hypothetical protein
MGVKKVGHCGTLDPMATVGIVGKGGGGWGWGWGVGRLSVSFSSLIAEVVSWIDASSTPLGVTHHE